MRLRLWIQGAAAGATIASVLTLNAASVGADPPSYAGWWTTANPGVSNSSVPTAVPGGGGPGGTPSDVPSKGLEVSNLPGDDSVAAIGYFGAGSSITKLVLHETPNAATVPASQVEACPLSGSGFFTPAYGAPASDEPKYSCDQHSPGVVDASAGTVSFAVSRFVRNDYLGVAIVAVAGTTTRMVFDPPGKDTVVVSSPPASPMDQAGAGSYAPAAPIGVPGGTVGAPRAPAPSGPASAGSSPSGGAISTGTGTPATPTPAQSPPSGAAARTSPQPSSAMVQASQATPIPVTQPMDTIRTGSAWIGVLLLLGAVVAVTRRNRRALSSPP